MALILKYHKHILKFTFEAGTSRGVMTERAVWLIKIYASDFQSVFGMGECAPLPGLSPESIEQMEDALDKVAERLSKYTKPANDEAAIELASKIVNDGFPSIRFAVETALLDLINEGQGVIIKNRFVASEDALPINGLVWMGDKDWMKRQIDEKLAEGYKCIKLKIGAIDFEEELQLLGHIRQRFASDVIDLRVDANGAFATNEVLAKLQELAKFDLHSIEQPIMPLQYEAMQLVCKHSKVPVALDEELIGINSLREKKELLSFISPSFIVLKPSLIGGIASTKEWIKVANDLNIGWWITSALESNVGLNSICQLAADFPLTMPQGLGTGKLYHNNIPSPLSVANGFIKYNRAMAWSLPEF